MAFEGADGLTLDAGGNVSLQTPSVAAVVDTPTPFAANDHVATRSGAPLAIAVLANDVFAVGARLTVVLAGGAGHGAVTVREDGTLVSTREPGFNGTDEFTCTAVSGAGLRRGRSVEVGRAAIGDTVGDGARLVRSVSV